MGQWRAITCHCSSEWTESLKCVGGESDVSALQELAHVGGKVIVEVLVLETGEVICVRVLAGHPLLVSATIKAVQQWKFDAFKTPEGVSKVVGTIGVNFKLR